MTTMIVSDSESPLLQHSAFQLEEREFIPEIDAELFQFRHKKSGARLFLIPSEDENRAFAVSFRTPAEDESGKAHILEHCVLSGSESFPLKEPFAALMKGSLASYLNAMTFEDRTVYPFASPNLKDFQNLLSVYLDAVFHPLVLQNALIFRQEAWHLEEAEDGSAHFTGVVCNEMSGDAASPSEILTEIYRKNLYDNAYRCISGGRPRGITALSWEELKAFHRRNYHPANADFFLYGKINPEECFSTIDAVISPFGSGQRREGIPAASSLSKAILLDDVYPSQDEACFGGIHLVLPADLSKDDEMLLRVLADTLFQRDFSPIREHFLENGICDDCYVSLESTRTNPCLELCLTGVRLQNAQELEAAFLSALDQLDEDEVRRLALASLARRAFVLREKNSGSLPLGLIYGMDLLLAPESRGKASESLQYEACLSRVQERIERGEAGAMIRRYFLDHPHRAAVLLQPDPEMGERLENEEKLRAQAYYQSLDPAALAALRAENRQMKMLQERPESEEALRCLPSLQLSDLSRTNRFKAPEEECAEERKLLYYPAFTAGISYLGFHFLINDASEHDLFLMSLLQEALASIATEKRNHTELSQLLFARTGGFGSSLGLYPDDRYFHLSLHLMEDEIRFGLQLLGEILTESKFSEQQQRLDLLFRALLDACHMDLLENGASYAAERAGSGVSPLLRASSEAGGLGFFLRLRNLMKAPDAKRAELCRELAETARKLFTADRLQVSYVGSQKGKALFVRELPFLLEQLPEKGGAFVSHPLSLTPLREAYSLPTTVQDTALAARFQEDGWHFLPAHQLLRAVLDKDYLWQEIRVLGGAYGASISLRRSGEILLSSYRDPRLRESLNVFKKLPNYLEAFRPSEAEWERFKIGTLADYDLPLSLPSEGKTAIFRVLRKVRLDQLQQEREDIIDAKPDILRQLAPSLRQALSCPSVCVFGPRRKLDESRDLFERIDVLL